MARRWQRVWIIPRSRMRGTSFQVVFYDATRGRRVYDRSFRNKHLAEEYARKLELHVNGAGPSPDLGGAFPSPAPPTSRGRLPWTETVDGWLERSAIRSRTRAWYGLVLRHFADIAGVKAVDDATDDTIAEFLSGIRRMGRSESTAAAYLRVLAAFLRSVRPSQMPISKALISHWKPYKDRKCRRPHYYTDNEYGRILSACDAIRVRRPGARGPLWWKAFITVLHECGLRLNEAAHLIWRDVDFANAELRIASHVNLKGVFAWRPKGKSLRTLPMPPDLVNLFSQMQDAQPERLPYVFVPQERYLHLLRRGLRNDGYILHGIRRHFVRIRESAGVMEGTIHDMRRTFVTNWLRRPEMSPEEVQLLAGHEDLQTTLGIYASVCDADVVAKAKRLLQNSNDSVSIKAATAAGS